MTKSGEEEGTGSMTVIDDWAIDYVLEGSVSVRNLFDVLAESFLWASEAE